MDHSNFVEVCSLRRKDGLVYQHCVEGLCFVMMDSVSPLSRRLSQLRGRDENEQEHQKDNERYTDFKSIYKL